MPFTVTEYLDLVRLLGEHPEWRTELRRLLLADDILELPRIVRELAEAQERTESRLERLEATVQNLVEAQQRTEARLQELVEVQRLTEEEVRKLATTTQNLFTVQKQMLDDMSRLKGWALEDRYRKHAYGYFGRWLRKARAVELIDLALVEDAYQSGQLTDEEWEELSALDLIVQGRAGKGAKAKDVLIALEVSSVIDASDVERAHRRAELLRRLGYIAVGGVGGETIRIEAETRAKKLGVAVTLDGRVQFWGALPGATP